MDFIFSPAFYLIMWLMTLANNFEKIAILKQVDVANNDAAIVSLSEDVTNNILNITNLKVHT